MGTQMLALTLARRPEGLPSSIPLREWDPAELYIAVSTGVRCRRDGIAQPVCWVLASSGEAYDASQCDVRIRSGDILWVPSEGLAAVLMGYSPICTKPGYQVDRDGAFDSFQPGTDWMSKPEWAQYTRAGYAAELMMARHAAGAAG